jgi:SPP1 family predicted phage head-tail adaptor
VTRAGAYRHFVTVESHARTEDGGGGYMESWTPFAEAFISVAPLSGRERLQAMKVAPEVTHRVLMRWRPDLPKQLRFRLGTRTLTQVGPWRNVEERNRDIEVLCAEVIQGAEVEAGS